MDSGVILSLNQWHVVEQLIVDEQLKMTEYEGRKFYVRRIFDKCE
jgi:hypothetical protein